MVWYIGALIVVPAFFVTLNLVMKRLDPLRERHQAAVNLACALIVAALGVGRMLDGVRSFRDWFFMCLVFFYVVYFVLQAIRARSVGQREQNHPAA